MTANLLSYNTSLGHTRLDPTGIVIAEPLFPEDPQVLGTFAFLGTGILLIEKYSLKLGRVVHVLYPST